MRTVVRGLQLLHFWLLSQTIMTMLLPLMLDDRYCCAHDAAKAWYAGFDSVPSILLNYTYGRRRDRSPHRQFRTVRNIFPLYSSSVYGHLLLIPAAFVARIFSMSSAVFSSWQWR